jgi:hypothetical protein
LASILRHGLGGALPDRKNFDCKDGVYLATEPSVAILILVEAALASALDTDSPQEVIDSMRLLVIDDSRIDASRCEPDPNVERRGLAFVYQGIVDVRGMPILDVDAAMKAPHMEASL